MLLKRSFSAELISLVGIYLLIHSVISWLIPNDVIFKKILFISFSLGIIGLFVFRTKNQVLGYLNIKVNPQLFPIARIFYSIICIYPAIQHFSLISSGIEPSNAGYFGLNLEASYAFTILYILGLVFLLFGWQVRAAWITVFLTGAVVIPFSLEIFLKNIVNFYAIFISTNLWMGMPAKQKYESSGVLLIALSFGFVISCAGIFKLVDPVWQNGLGLYYSLNISFLTPSHLWWLLNNKALIVFLNHITTAVEISSFPLLLYPKTRILGMFTLLGLGIFLSYPMAGIGSSLGPVILAISPIFISTFWRTMRVHHDNQINTKQKIDSNWKKYVTLALFWYCFLGFYIQGTKKLSNIMQSPPIFGSFLTPNAKRFQLPSFIQWRSGLLRDVLNHIRPSQYFESACCLPLFNYHHLFDRMIFKVQFFDKEGNIYEPRRFFNSDGSKSKEYPLIYNQRFILSSGRIMVLMQNADKFGNIPKDFKKYIKEEFDPIIVYCLKELPTSIKPEMAVISVKPLYQPFSYEGKSKPWIHRPYYDFYSINYLTGEETLSVKNIPFYEFSSLDIEAFKDNQIIPR